MAGIAERILASAPPRFALAGLSMGGYVAFEILRKAPERVERLMLLSTNARADSEEQRDLRFQKIALARQGQFDRVAALQWPQLVHASRLDDAELRERFQRMTRDTGAEAFIRQQQAILARIDSRPGLADIACPAVVMVGEDDVITPPALAEEMAAGIAGARLQVIPRCGHLCAMERANVSLRRCGTGC